MGSCCRRNVQCNATGTQREVQGARRQNQLSRATARQHDANLVGTNLPTATDTHTEGLTDAAETDGQPRR
jgi:hypothetical protein